MSTPSTLVSISELARNFDLKWEAIDSMLKAVGLMAAHTVNRGGAISNLYDRVEAETCVKHAIAARADALRLADEDMTRLQRIGRDFNESATIHSIHEMVKGCENAICDILVETEQMGEDRANVKKLIEQNVIMFRTLGDIGLKLDALYKKVDAKPEPLVSAASTRAPTPAVEAPAAPVAPVVKPLVRVAIVGLRTSQAMQIEKEFKQCFALNIYTSENAKGKHFEDALGRADHVIAMMSSINDGFLATKKGAGAKLIHHNGGFSTLRERLTTLFVEQTA